MCSADSQGRVLIPSNLKQYAKIEKQIVSIGVVDRAEIWAKEEWDSYNSGENFVDSSLSDKMADLGI